VKARVRADLVEIEGDFEGEVRAKTLRVGEGAHARGLFFADRMVRPLLVVQGDKDARVKKDQSDRIVDSLKKRGVPVHYLVLENEGHGFSRNESYQAAYEATDRFLDRYLLGDTTAAVLPGEVR